MPKTNDYPLNYQITILSRATNQIEAERAAIKEFSFIRDMLYHPRFNIEGSEWDMAIRGIVDISHCIMPIQMW